MCVEVHQGYQRCSCKIVRYWTCLNHITHTRRQIDNSPCPGLEIRFVETQDAPVGPDGVHPAGPCKTKSTYTFEHWTDWRYNPEDWRFCEQAYWGVNACEESGRWLFDADHTCGMGPGELYRWRHLKAFPEVEVKKEPKEEDKETMFGEGQQVKIKSEMKDKKVKFEDELKPDVYMKEDKKDLTSYDVKMEDIKETNKAEEDDVKVKLEDFDSY